MRHDGTVMHVMHVMGASIQFASTLVKPQLLSDCHMISSIKPMDKRDGGGAHNWGRQEDAAVDDWPSEEPEAQQDTQEPVANGEVVPEHK